MRFAIFSITHTHVFFIHSPADGHVAYFHNDAMNTEMQVSLWGPDFISFGYISRSGIAESYSGSIINFLSNFHIVFHNGYPNLHF